MQAGAPLRCSHPTSKNKPRGRTGLFTFMAARRKSRKERDGTLPKLAAGRERGELLQEWNELSDDERATWADKELAAGCADPEPDPCPARQLSDCFWGLASADLPISVAAFEATVRQALDIAEDERIRGLNRILEPLRSKFLESIFVPDRG